MEGLSAKVFRTYNASTTLQDQLNQLTESKSNIHEKLLSYNRANRAVAILCNHQIKNKRADIKQCKKDLKTLKREKVPEQ
ncbi:hypothetical protein MXB_3443 [Myxobolus squamalis]|nr:hypothetical protein MXB_3443 [Myxobolus squamalis]